MKTATQLLAPTALTATGSTSKAATVNGASVGVLVNVSAASGSPSMVVSLQWSNDGTAWSDGDPADSMTAITGITSKCKSFVSKGAYVRALYTISGGTPSLTTAIDIFSID